MVPTGQVTAALCNSGTRFDRLHSLLNPLGGLPAASKKAADPPRCSRFLLFSFPTQDTPFIYDYQQSLQYFRLF